MKTVLLLRHADIDPPVGAAPDDWPLNAVGQARAAELAHVAGSAAITTIFVSPALRTQQTVAPLAALLSLSPKQVPPLSQLAGQLQSGEAGDVVLIAGHSNTIPQMITAFGTSFSGPALHGHDDLFVLTVTGLDQARVVRLKYGSSTP